MERVVIAENGCWEWQGYRNADGYGQFFVKDLGEKLAHRVAYIVFVGPIPDRLRVLHRCDNPPCIRPTDLFLGTQADNVADATAKGRNHGYKWSPEKIRWGETHPRAKLTEADVREIKRRLAAGELGYRLAAEFGVTKSLVSRIKVGKAWIHLP